MYKSELERRRSKATVAVSVCVISLVLLTKFVSGQVVIVPNTPKTNSKAKSKPRPKVAKTVTPASASSPVPTPTPTLTPAPTPSQQPDPSPNSNSTRSPYAVPFPLPPVNVKRTEPAVDVKRTEPAVEVKRTDPVVDLKRTGPAVDLKRTEPEARVAPPINLSEYQFDVITGDQRGKVTQSSKNRARYFTENLSDGAVIEMVEIPGGTFLMGTAADEIAKIARETGREVEREMKERLPERLQWETPQHMVRVSEFYLSKTEVTQAQWRAVAQLPKVKKELPSDPSYFKGSSRPVE